VYMKYEVYKVHEFIVDSTTTTYWIPSQVHIMTHFFVVYVHFISYESF
jgi:hypothetical protein